MSLESRNPATGKLTQSFEPIGPDAVEAALEAADGTFAVHRRLDFATRATKMHALADLLDERKTSLADLVTEEMGKTIRAAEAEIGKCAWVCRYYADNAEAFLSDTRLETDAAESFIRHAPLGPLLAIMPWNFPFWQAFRAAVPAIMAGNVVLLKHASNVPRVALAIQQQFLDAGFPPGTFTTLLIGSDRVERLIEDDRIRAVTLTGSARAGAAVAAAAGHRAKKTVLELGGSDAYIVMPSADLETAARTGATARTINNGQSCIAAKRFIVHRKVYDSFVAMLTERLEALVVGDPASRNTDVGPLVSDKIRSKLDQQVEASLKLGGRRVSGARIIDGRGFYYRPGIVADIPRGAPLYSDEVFGPVAAVFPVRDIDAAVALANDTRYGLGSSVWTRDPREQIRFIRDLEAGATFVNAMVKSDPRAPFGGIKASGYGRELSRDGILAFVNRKTVHID